MLSKIHPFYGLKVRRNGWKYFILIMYPKNGWILFFGEVIYMLMEWSYHKVDEYGIKMAAYAHFAINKRYSGIRDESSESREKRPLYEQFGYS